MGARLLLLAFTIVPAMEIFKKLKQTSFEGMQ